MLCKCLSCLTKEHQQRRQSTKINHRTQLSVYSDEYVPKTLSVLSLNATAPPTSSHQRSTIFRTPDVLQERRCCSLPTGGHAYGLLYTSGSTWEANALRFFPAYYSAYCPKQHRLRRHRCWLAPAAEKLHLILSQDNHNVKNDSATILT